MDDATGTGPDAQPERPTEPETPPGVERGRSTPGEHGTDDRTRAPREPGTGTRAAPEPRAVPGAAAEAAPGPAAETVGPQAAPGPGSVPAAASETAAAARTTPHSGAEAGSGPHSGAEAEAARDSGAEAEAGPDSGAEAEAARDSGAEAEAGPDSGAEAAPRTRAGTSRRARRFRWVRRGVLVVVLVVLLPLLAAETALRVNYAGDPARGTHTRGRDAIWLGHAWVDGRKKDADVAALAERLRGTGIRDLYVHAGPLEHDGTLPASAYANARWLVPAVHRALPGVRVQAWLGDVLATESPEGLRLERAATRAAVVRSTRAVLAAGFDGAHFDLEPLHSGDRDYLALLDALHDVTRARGVPLSVAAHQIDPLPGFHSIWGTLTNHPKWWSQAYFAEVARRVDQIAVMSYDTMQPLPSLYGGYVAQQTSLALEATPPTTDLLMGLPFFHDNRFGHREAAETVPAAVRGVRLGLSRTDADRERFGVALYVDFAATEEDWTAYRRGWTPSS